MENKPESQTEEEKKKEREECLDLLKEWGLGSTPSVTSRTGG